MGGNISSLRSQLFHEKTARNTTMRSLWMKTGILVVPWISRESTVHISPTALQYQWAQS